MKDVNDMKAEADGMDLHQKKSMYEWRIADAVDSCCWQEQALSQPAALGTINSGPLSLGPFEF